MDEYDVFYKVNPSFFTDRALTTATVTDDFTFKKVTSFVADSLDEIYDHFQAENWSPNGEARNLISSLGLHHTSMSVGDVIRNNRTGIFYQVASIGFLEVKP